MIIMIASISAVVVLIIAGLLVKKFTPGKLNSESYARRWQAVQKHCANKKSWVTAVVEADHLLDEVLKKRRYKGKTTGERLVKAQHDLKNNESVWFGHKLCNRIKQEELKKISKHDTLESLSGFRQALKDLGALKDTVRTPPVIELANPENQKPETST